MGHDFIDLEDITAQRPDQYHRWIQPPQIAYFVTSMDKDGNTNTTPVTMGTTVCSPSGFFIPFAVNDSKRQTFLPICLKHQKAGLDNIRKIYDNLLNNCLTFKGISNGLERSEFSLCM